MPFPERKMVAAKDKFEKVGYTEDIFDDDYWLYSDDKNPARIDKSALQLINYFKNLFVENNIPWENFVIGDIGAGAGNMVNQFRNAGFKSEGCEFSESGRRIAKEKFGIVLGDCDLRKRLPYENDAFDWSFCVGVLSMIPAKNMKNALEELFRVTKYGVLINVGTTIANNKVDRRGNPHHLTSMTTASMWTAINVMGYYDWTSIQPPQRGNFGIGVAGEFCGLFGKTMWPF